MELQRRKKVRDAVGEEQLYVLSRKRQSSTSTLDGGDEFLRDRQVKVFHGHITALPSRRDVSVSTTAEPVSPSDDDDDPPTAGAPSDSASRVGLCKVPLLTAIRAREGESVNPAQPCTSPFLRTIP